MSFVWATIALLVLLLPGFFFLVCLYVPRNFDRDVAPRSPLEQLAGIVFVSLLVNGVFYLALGSPSGRGPLGLPAVDTRMLLAILQLNAGEGTSLSAMATALERSRLWILLYVLASSITGAAAGALVGKRIASGPLAFLAQHRWVYQLSVHSDVGFILAYILTHTERDGRVLMYSGFLFYFGLTREGRFSYVVLRNPVRFYMHLEPDLPRTHMEQGWHVIGAGGGLETTVETEQVFSSLVIEGEDIANVVFERKDLVVTEADRERVEDTRNDWVEEALETAGVE